MRQQNSDQVHQKTTGISTHKMQTNNHILKYYVAMMII